MPRQFRSYEPDQGLLLPPSVRDWLPEDHLAFFVSDAIDAMDLGAFEARYRSVRGIGEVIGLKSCEKGEGDATFPS